MNKKLAILGAAILLGAGTAAAQKSVTGRVVDKDGTPVVGASIRIDNKAVTVTDADGNFKLTNVPSTAKKIQVSYIGMTTASVNISNSMSITLTEDATSLGEAMVVAYGTATRSSFTGSAAVVGSEVIENQVATNVTSALAGTTSGVQFMSSNGDPTSNTPTIRIRGIGSLSASNAPLYVVDGMPYDGPINAINPQDVESMTVLKDASASAIYGARGANGVVLITTKKGKTQDAKVKFDAKWGSNNRLIPQYDVVKDPGQYYEQAFKRLYNTNIVAGMSAADAYANANERLYNQNDGGLGYQIYTLPEGENLIGTNFKLNPNAKLGYSNGENYYTPDDWYGETFHSSFRQEYNVSIDGASDKMKYYAGLNYLNDGGIVNNSNLTRYGARLNVDYQVRKWMKFGTNMNYSHTDSKQPSYTTGSWASSGNLFYICNNIAPIYPLYVRDAQGNIMYQNGLPIYDANQTAFTRAGVVGNAVRDNEYNSDKTTRDVFTGVGSVVINPVKGLTLSANLGLTVNNARANYLGSAFGSYSSVDGGTSVSSERMQGMNQQYLAQYNTDFNGSKHNLEILAGYEQYNYKYQYLYGYNDHLYDPYIGELDNAKGTKSKSLRSYTDNYMTEGFLSRLQYDYAGKYFVSASYRRDASSRFAPGHRWGNFGSVGLAWQMNKENFLADVEWINLLKFKASYGVTGNDHLLDANGYDAYYPYADMYTTSYNEETGQYSITMSQKGNDELTWETSHAFNTGFDFNLFNSRLNGNIEYFARRTSDLLYNKDVPLSSGISVGYFPINIGAVLNHGVEIELEGVLVRTKNVEWSVNTNLTSYKNIIKELDPSIAEDGYKTSYYIWKIGGSVYETYMYKYAGVDAETGDALYYTEDEDGNISTTNSLDSATRFDCGSTLPKVYGGFGTSLKFWDFDFTAQFSYQLGGQIYDGAYQSLMWTQDQSGSNMHKDLLNAWTPENTDTDIPRWYSNQWGGLAQSTCDYFLTSSNYLSINNVTLGYTLPKNIMKKASISALRLYVAGENLAVFSARKGLDPRFTTGLGTMTSGSGRSGDYYSAMRTITGGISVTF